MARSSPQVLRLFVSSPGDVPDERQAILDIGKRLASEPLLGGKVVIQPVLWEVPGLGVPLLATTTPQEAINRGLCRPSECDLVFVILAGRLGTPLPREVDGRPFLKPDGLPFRSGTEWEYLDALRGHNENRLPEVVVYRRTVLSPLHSTDPDFVEKQKQRQLVADFFSAFHNSDGSLPRGYQTYTTVEDFTVQAERAIRRLLPLIVETRAQGVGPLGLAPGQCPSCKHVHPDWQDRNACDRCQTIVREPCTGCGTLNGVWSKFCGNCRIDLQRGLDQVRTVLGAQQQHIARMVKSGEHEAALALIEKLHVPEHSALIRIRQWLTDWAVWLRVALTERQQQLRQQANDQEQDRFEELARKGRWREAATALAGLRRLNLNKPGLKRFHTRLATGLRELVRAEPEDVKLRHLYLEERTADLAAEDEQAGQLWATLLTGFGVSVCIVLCPLLVLLPLVLGTIRRMAPGRRFSQYGPLPLPSLLLSEQALRRRYCPDSAAGPYEEGFSPLGR